MEIPLKDLKNGQKGTIVAFNGDGKIRKRLMEMGIIRGETVELERTAPLGDPIQIRVKGYRLSLRKSEAADVMVRLEEAGPA